MLDPRCRSAAIADPDYGCSCCHASRVRISSCLGISQAVGVVLGKEKYDISERIKRIHRQEGDRSFVVMEVKNESVTLDAAARDMGDAETRGDHTSSGTDIDRKIWE